MLPSYEKNFTMTICGKRRSGKSWFCRRLLQSKYNCVFDRTYFITNADTTVDKEWDNYLFNERINSYDNDKLRELYDDWCKYAKNEEEVGNERHCLFILEDCAQVMRNTKQKECVITDIFLNGRHQNVSVILLVQNIKIGMSQVLRNNTECLITFAIGNNNEMKIVAEEFFGDTPGQFKIFNDKMKKNRYSFTIVQCVFPFKRQIFDANYKPISVDFPTTI